MSSPSRREKLEGLLAASPDDTFLLYGVALEHLKEGNEEEGIGRLKKIIDKDADYQAAYFQIGQFYAGVGDDEEARRWLEQGVEAARRVGNTHAASEMMALMETL